MRAIRGSGGIPLLRSALVISHPGHELLIHHWLETSQPTIFVLSAGADDNSALAESVETIYNTHSKIGKCFGVFSDQEIENQLMNHNEAWVLELVETLSDEWMQSEIDLVVGDAAEGVDPIHDFCRLVIDGAVRRLAYRYNHHVANYDFAITHHPNSCSPLQSVQLLQMALNADDWQRKRAAILQHRSMHLEFLQLFQQFGENVFQMEYLRPVIGDSFGWSYNPQRLRTLYSRLDEFGNPSLPRIRFEEHLLPLINLIDEAYPIWNQNQAA